MKFGPEQALDRERVVVGDETSQRVGGGRLTGLRERSEGARGFGALRGRVVLGV